MSSTKPKKIVVVLGMHRSGTSAITRALPSLGIDLGDKLIKSGSDNPKGFWEDQDCLAINQELLIRLNSTDVKFASSWKGLDKDSALNDLLANAKELIIKKSDQSKESWGFKDPRTCRLLSFWLNVFEQTGYKPYFVIAVRNPLSVSASLYARNNLSFQKSFILWLQHLIPSILDTREYPSVVVDYDQMLDNPEKQIERMAKVFGLSPPEKTSSDLVTYKNIFLEESLRHTKYTLEDLKSHNKAGQDVIKAYELLSELSADRLSLKSEVILNTFSEIDSRLRAINLLLEYVESLESEVNTLRKSTVEYDAIISTAKAALSGKK